MLKMEYTPEEIVEALLAAAGDYPGGPEVTAAAVEAVEWIQCAAENEYNNDYWRVIYAVLNAVAERYEKEGWQ